MLQGPQYNYSEVSVVVCLEVCNKRCEEQMTNDAVLILATAVGPVLGVLLGWRLNERSARSRLRRAEDAARFAVARGLMRSRHSLEMSAYINELPLYSSGDEQIMRLYRDLAYGRSADRARDMTHLILAVVRRVGVTHDLEQEGVARYIRCQDEDVLSSPRAAVTLQGNGPLR